MIGNQEKELVLCPAVNASILVENVWWFVLYTHYHLMTDYNNDDNDESMLLGNSIDSDQ